MENLIKLRTDAIVEKGGINVYISGNEIRVSGAAATKADVRLVERLTALMGTHNELVLSLYGIRRECEDAGFPNLVGRNPFVTDMAKIMEKIDTAYDRAVDRYQKSPLTPSGNERKAPDKAAIQNRVLRAELENMVTDLCKINHGLAMLIGAEVPRVLGFLCDTRKEALAFAANVHNDPQARDEAKKAATALLSAIKNVEKTAVPAVG